MSHKTLISGTAYEVSGGKTLIDSTVYEIDKGKTLVDGTAYEVGFAPPAATVTVNITNSAYRNGDYCINVTVLGTVCYYERGQATVEVPVGTVITCFARPYERSEFARIYLNGTQVAGGKSENGYTYSYTVTTNVAITTNTDEWEPTIYITEQ